MITKKYGFTLAEILITLAIIGLIAAITIPALITKINNIITINNAKIINAKLIKGLNLTKTAGDLNNTYSSTYDFILNGLSKNLKIIKVCDSNNIKNCIPYNKIKFNTKNNFEKEIDIAEIDNAKKLNLKTPYTDIAAFVLADGTPIIASYNLNCIDDADKADTEINKCLAGLYDLNGTRKPNKLSKDIISFNGAGVFGSECTTVMKGVCVTKSFVSNDNLIPLIQEIDNTYIKPISINGDGSEYTNYWQLAKDYCEKVENSKLTDLTNLKKIAAAIYGVDEISNSMNSVDFKKSPAYTELGINASWFAIWYDQPNEGCPLMQFERTVAMTFPRYGGLNWIYAICIDN